MIAVKRIRADYCDACAAALGPVMEIRFMRRGYDYGRTVMHLCLSCCNVLAAKITGRQFRRARLPAKKRA